MKDLFSRSLQTTIIFLIVGGILALAFGGFFSPVSNQFTNGLVSVQYWFAIRYQAIEQFLSAPRDIITLRARNAELETQISQLQT